MATTYPSIAAEQKAMSTKKVINAHGSVRTPAPDQRFAKAPSLTKAEAKKIAKAAYERILAGTGREDVAREHQQRMERILPGPVSW